MSGHYDLRVIGDVTILPCEDVKSASCTILIMGDTGAGKSTLIEALSGEARSSLDISKDQLAGFTQEVNAYRLKNAGYIAGPDDHEPWPVYLIDTPGFSDTKLSEMSIVKKIKNWMAAQCIDIVSLIFYLCPITDTRIPGRKRRTIKMIQSLLQTNSARHITVVTTMWDSISNSHAKSRAEMHYLQLKDDIWKDVIENGGTMARFLNDYQSAVDIVRSAILNVGGRVPLCGGEVSHDHPAAPFLYQELLERIESTRQQRQTFELERNDLLIRPNSELEFFVAPALHAAEQDLAKFMGELVVFGTPPPGFEVIPEQVAYQELIDRVKANIEHIRTIKLALKHCSDKTRRCSLKEQIRRDEGNLKRFTMALIGFGVPPQGFQQPRLPYRALGIKQSIMQAKREARSLFAGTH